MRSAGWLRRRASTTLSASIQVYIARCHNNTGSLQ
jgi:hypothetical protein